MTSKPYTMLWKKRERNYLLQYLNCMTSSANTSKLDLTFGSGFNLKQRITYQQIIRTLSSVLPMVTLILMIRFKKSVPKAHI